MQIDKNGDYWKESFSSSGITISEVAATTTGDTDFFLPVL